jgi:methylthioribose-1-phosphate isomerase
MKVDGRPYRTIWPLAGGGAFEVIDQTLLPHRFTTRRIDDLDAAIHAIASMIVRGAPLIGATAAYGLALGLRHDSSDAGLERAYGLLLRSRPTAVNLRYALDDVRGVVSGLAPRLRADAAWSRAGEICDEDVQLCQRIGEAGLPLIEKAHKRLGRPVNILTHCNAGWLATVDWGTATAPIYMAHDRGVPVHVFVDETRPRNQGAALTAFELGHHGVPHTIIVDNAGGHLMQHGRVDLCIVGADRVTARGDAANKIGTYLKALAARANGVPFYVALPHTTIDWTIRDGLREIEIEERDPGEVTHIAGRLDNGEIARVMVTAPGSPVANPAFDVTPAELVTALITDRGACPASTDALLALFPERRQPVEALAD